MRNRKKKEDPGEFLWLTSLSDLMILLFVFFVMLFSFTYKKVKQSDFKEVVATIQNKPKPVDPVQVLEKDFKQWAETQKLSEQISVSRQDDAILIEVKDNVFFSSGAYRLHEVGLQKLESLAKALTRVPEKFHIGIEGHTDNVPIHTSEIEDNWELSSKRALAVLRALNLPEKLQKRTSAIAWGDVKPIAPNQDDSGSSLPDNQAKNRRVTFRIF
mgnify:CR=1 FL=1